MHAECVVGKPEEKKRIWMCNIKIDHKIIGCDNVDWIHLAQYRVRLCTLLSTVWNPRSRLCE
jgi:hypothetical protein